VRLAFPFPVPFRCAGFVVLEDEPLRLDAGLATGLAEVVGIASERPEGVAILDAPTGSDSLR
jgi:hypothetical protein